MDTNFCDSHINYLQKNQTIIAYYASSLNRSNDELIEKRLHLKKKKKKNSDFHYDNAPAEHTHLQPQFQI